MALSTIDTASISGLGYGFKNRIINGGMMIDARNAGASVTPSNNQYATDRWQGFLTAASKYSFQQSSTAPTGFVNSLLFTSLSSYSVSASDTFGFRQKIEGLNTADLGWGTSAASAVTLSFWVRSSLTGTFGGAVQNSDQNRNYPFSYTISAANTWEQKYVTIAGDTTGTWLTTNGIGISIIFNLGSGSTYSGTAGSWSSTLYFAPTGATSVVGTSGATFYITGVQLEKGTVATSFDWRPYGTELALCQRYYSYLGSPYTGGESGVGAGLAISSTSALCYSQYPMTMRAVPTVAVSGTLVARHSGGQNSFTSLSAAYAGVNAVETNMVISGSSNGSGVVLRNEAAAGAFTFSAEL